MRTHLTGAVVAATAALLGLGTLTAPTAHAAEPYGTITGTVTAEVGGAPLDDVAVGAWFQVTVDGSPSWTAVWTGTDSQGRYTLPVSPGEYRIQFVECEAPCADPSHASEFYDDAPTLADAEPLTVADNQDVSGIDAALAAGYLVSGRVTKPDASNAADALVAVYASGGTTVTSTTKAGADGRYAVVVPAGTYRLGFADKTGAYGEFFENKQSLATATAVAVDADVANLDVHLDLPQVRNVPDAEPVVHGIERVGDTLTVTPGLWYPFSEDYDFTYAWFRSGSAAPIGTGTTLVVPPAAQGETITVQVTAALEGYTSSTATSDPTAPIAAAPAALQNSAPPTITGAVKVGETVMASPGTWEKSPSAVLYQWYADAQAIAGATRSTLTITPDLLGTRLSVTVVAAAPGTLAGYSGATASTLVQRGTLAVASAPTLAGRAKVGKKLKVVVAPAVPASATVQVQWLVKGKVITGATKKALRLKRSLQGAKVRAQVTYAAPGYAPLVVRTRAVRVR